VEGRNVTLALRYGDGSPERMPSLAQELVALNPDVVIAGATSGASAAYKATRTVPIVAIIPEDPVAAGFAQSIAKPGGNVTGTWNLGDDALVGKKLDFFKLPVPGLARVGVMLNPDDPADSVQIPSLPAAARAVGVTMEVIVVRDLNNLDAAAAQIMRASVQGLFVGVAPFWFSAQREITAMVARLKLPAVYGWRKFADAGGLMSYGLNLPELYRQSGNDRLWLPEVRKAGALRLLSMLAKAAQSRHLRVPTFLYAESLMAWISCLIPTALKPRCAPEGE
jgi:putative ABC transport system substrate-binding protein